MLPAGRNGKKGGRRRARSQAHASVHEEGDELPAKRASVDGQQDMPEPSEEAADVQAAPPEKKAKRRRLERMQA